MNTIEVNRVLTEFNERKTAYDNSVAVLITMQEKLEQSKQLQLDTKKALAVIQDTAQVTQNMLRNKITNLVNLAIRSVFDDPPLFIMEITLKRNRTECELLFKDGDSVSKPIESAGGGLLDIVSLALRIVMWTFTNTDNTLILDEPAKFCSPDLAPKVSTMLSELSKKLDLQIIMVSHQADVNLAADMTYMVKQEDKTSVVTQL